MPKASVDPCADRYHHEIAQRVQHALERHKPPPKLVGFLANDDAGARMYARWTQRACDKDGIQYELRQVEKQDLEDHIVAANADPDIHGIIVYYPVFGGAIDDYLRDVISLEKDVEGLNHRYRYSLYHDIRTLPDLGNRKCVLPCTPLAILKIIHYLGAYKTDRPLGDQLHGHKVVVFNRSEVVGRPLAAMLANDGATVYSVDVTGMLVYRKGRVPGALRAEETSATVDEALAFADIVISGVPSKSFSIDAAKIRAGAIAINFAPQSNFSAGIEERASAYVPAIGKVTIAMLERNLLRLHAAGDADDAGALRGDVWRYAGVALASAALACAVCMRINK